MEPKSSNTNDADQSFSLADPTEQMSEKRKSMDLLENNAEEIVTPVSVETTTSPSSPDCIVNIDEVKDSASNDPLLKQSEVENLEPSCDSNKASWQPLRSEDAIIKLSQTFEMISLKLDSMERRIDENFELTSLRRDESLQSLAAADLTNKMNQMMETLSTKMDSMERRMEEKLALIENRNVKEESSTSEKRVVHFDECEIDQNSLGSTNIVNIEKVSEQPTSQSNRKDLAEKPDNCRQIPSLDAITATNWLNNIFLNVTANTLEIWLSLMKQFAKDIDFERHGCEVLQKITQDSESVVHSIAVNPEVLSYCMQIFETNWNRKDWDWDIHINLLSIMSGIARDPDRMVLLTTAYIQPILEVLAKKHFDEDVLLSANVFAHLLDLPEERFPEKFKKNLLEQKVLEAIDSFEMHEHFIRMEYPWFLAGLKTGTKAQRYYCAWMLANQSIQSKEKIIENGAIPILRSVILDSTTDTQLRKLAKKAFRFLSP